MTVDAISTHSESPRQVCCCSSKKAIILIAVCCVAILSTYMYSLNCCKSRKERPRILQILNAPSRNNTTIFTKVKTISRMPETTVNATKSTKQTVSVDQLLSSLSQNLSPRRDQDDISSSASWSSVFDEDYDDSDSVLEEGSILKAKGVLKRRLPQVIIIGIKKGGTRALLNFLKAHPQVITVSGKEVHFFDRYYERGLEWYRKAMPYSYENQLTVEKTPSYFVTLQVPKRIYNMSPDTKFLLVVRDPVARAISDHAQSLSKGKTMPFEEKALLDPTKCSVDESWSAIGIGLYSVHLARWLKYFSLNQFLFVSGENLVANPGAEMGRVQDFMQIRTTLTEKSFVFDEAKGFPCLREGKNGETKCLGKSKGRPHNPVDPHVRACLAAFYRPYNEQFYKMTGINFHWEK